MENKKQKIIDVLRQKYNPVAILLHGSRAVGMEREHSDWDVYMIFDHKIPRRSYREEIAGEDVEWKSFLIPSEEESIMGVFDIYLQFAQVLWEKDLVGTDIIQRAKLVYSKGPALTSEEVAGYKQYMAHKLLGMEDDIESPELFFRHLGVFANRSVNYWYEIKKNEFSKPLYMSIPDIEKRDPEYARFVKVLTSDKPKAEKINAGRKIMELLYK